MKISNGKILILFGIVHPLFGVTPFAFGRQFDAFASKYFFSISNGLWEFPLLNGQMNYENFAVFWFLYFGILLIPFGMLLNYVEKINQEIPFGFKMAYLLVIILGVYMIPFSGITLFMLPHALYMFLGRKKPLNQTDVLHAKPLQKNTLIR